MLPLESQVCSLESAKRLKELNCRQESLFWWYSPDDSGWIGYGGADDAGNRISAFTCAELGEMLPRHHRNFDPFIINDVIRDWMYRELSVSFRSDGDAYVVGKISVAQGVMKRLFPNLNREDFADFSNETEARAKMLIYLLENNLIPSERKE